MNDAWIPAGFCLALVIANIPLNKYSPSIWTALGFGSNIPRIHSIFFSLYEPHREHQIEKDEVEIGQAGRQMKDRDANNHMMIEHRRVEYIQYTSSIQAVNFISTPLAQTLTALTRYQTHSTHLIHRVPSTCSPQFSPQTHQYAYYAPKASVQPPSSQYSQNTPSTSFLATLPQPPQ